MEIEKHEFQADCDRRSVRKQGEILNLSKKNFNVLKLKKFNDEINNFFINGYYSKIWNYVKLHHRSLNEMEELKSSTFDTVARRRLVDDQDTILELTGKIQELWNDCMNDSRDFQDAESIRSAQTCATHLIQFLKEW